MMAALDSQLVEPFDPDPLPAGVGPGRAGHRRIEMRVSVPQVGMLMATFGAWLDGIRDHLILHPASDAAVPRVRDSQVGLIFHFIKVGTGKDAEDRATEAAQRLIGALEQHPWLRHFVAGVDAAGEERNSSPRVFIQAFSMIRRMENESRELGRSSPLRLGYTFHVGEDVDDLLTGLRHIDEVVNLLLPQGDGGRLGHALALGESVERFYDRRGVTEPALGAHLLDLVWAHGRLTESRNLGAAGSWIPWLERRLWLAAGRSADHRPRILDCYRAMEMDPRGGTEGHTEERLLSLLLERCSGLDLATPWPVPLTEGPWIEIVQSLQAELRHRIARWRICVEGNPTSNLLIGGYKDYAGLPYETLVNDGIAVSLNTDDPGLFMTTLPGELAAMYDALASTGRPHREILAWLRERVFDAEQSTFLDRHIPAGETAMDILELWRQQQEL